MLGMLSGIEKGVAFDNVLKGDLQLTLAFSSLPALKRVQSLIEWRLQ